MLSTAFAATYFWLDQRSCDVRRTPSAVSEAGRVALTTVNVAGLFRTHKLYTARWVQDVFIWCFFECFWVFHQKIPTSKQNCCIIIKNLSQEKNSWILLACDSHWYRSNAPDLASAAPISVEKDGENSQTKQVVHGGSVVFEPTLHISSLFLAKDKAAHSSHWTPDHMRCQVQLSHHVQGTIQGDTKIIHQCWREYAGGRFSMLCTWQAGFDSCNAGITYMMNAKASLLVDWSKRYVQ